MISDIPTFALGTVPLPLVLEDPFTREKPVHSLTKEDCKLYESFLVKNDSVQSNGGEGDTFHSESVVVQSSNRTRSDTKLVVNKDVMKTSLDKSEGSLKVLGLNFCYSVDEEVLKMIADHCRSVEYLDLSFSEPGGDVNSTVIPSFIWNCVSTSLGTTLVHLNLTCFDGIDDSGLSELFRHCSKLENIELSVAPFRPLTGSSLSKTPKSVRKVSLFIETDKANASFCENVLSSLAKSEAKEYIRRLRIRRLLTNEAMSIISNNFNRLSCLDIVESSSPSLDYTKLGYSIAKLKDLEELLIQVPEQQEFSTELSNIFHNCSKLTKLSIFGGVIDDETLELLPVLLPNIEFIAFSHLFYDFCRHFEHEFTNAAFQTFAKLKKLKHLKINNAFITDRAAIKFFENFQGDINQLQTFDARNCRKITVKTLNVCLEKSKLREETDCVPLKVYCDNSYKMETVDATPSTIEFSSLSWCNSPGFWNEYFTPWFNYNENSQKTVHFIVSQLQLIGEKYLHKTYSRLRSFYLKSK